MTQQRKTKSALAPRVALVLSGGGARGAYEAGILAYLFGDLVRQAGRAIHFDIVTGSSVGAIHASYVAAHQQEADAGERLAAIWRSLSFDTIFEVGATDLLRIPWRLLGLGTPTELPATKSRPARIAGAFDTTRLEQLVLDQIEWAKIRRNLAEGSLDALAVTATEIATGRSVVFVDTPTDQLPVWTRDPFIIARSAQIDASHTLASAAIPVLFPAVRIGPTYYCDGGLRLNTPLVPALRLGADRVLIIGLRHPATTREQDRLARAREANYTNPAYLAGKALNALLLDRVETDVDRLRLFNAILECGADAYGDGFLARINKPIIERRNTPYRIVPDMFLRPSEDLGEIAARCLRHQPPASGIRSWLTRNIARYAARGAVLEADLLSYLLFDRCYAEHLIELGRRDAEQAADQLLSFLFDEMEEKE